jgi:DNA-binding NarL/FixJ family response regulator
VKVARADKPAAWLFVSGTEVPAIWLDRAVPAMLVPLLPDEARQVLSGRSAHSELAPQDVQLARLAAQGHTVTAIARELQVNRRTVDRRLAVLRRCLGVASTTELAVALAERGFALPSSAPAGVAGHAGPTGET